MKIRAEGIVAFILLVVFAASLYYSSTWGVASRLMPLIAGVGGTGFTLWVVIAEIIRARSGEKTPEKKEAETEEAKRKAILKAEIKKRKGKATLWGEEMMILWIAGFVLMFIVFGFWIATAAFIPAFLLVFGHEKWKVAAIYTPVALIAIYVAFVMGVKMSLYSGLLNLVRF